MNLIIAAMIAASGDPATAQTNTVQPTPAIVAPGQAESGGRSSKRQRYCVTGTLTGSRIARNSCRTRDEWLALGFDPLAPTDR